MFSLFNYQHESKTSSYVCVSVCYTACNVTGEHWGQWQRSRVSNLSLFFHSLSNTHEHKCSLFLKWHIICVVKRMKQTQNVCLSFYIITKSYKSEYVQLAKEASESSITTLWHLFRYCVKEEVYSSAVLCFFNNSSKALLYLLISTGMKHGKTPLFI